MMEKYTVSFSLPDVTARAVAEGTGGHVCAQLHDPALQLFTVFVAL